MTRRSVTWRFAMGWALLLASLGGARVTAAAAGDEPRDPRPSTVDYVDGTVGVD